MVRITGLFDGIEYVLVDYGNGVVECPTDLQVLLTADQPAMPIGTELLEHCRVLFGDSMQVKEYA